MVDLSIAIRCADAPKGRKVERQKGNTHFTKPDAFLLTFRFIISLFYFFTFLLFYFLPFYLFTFIVMDFAVALNSGA